MRDVREHQLTVKRKQKKIFNHLSLLLSVNGAILIERLESLNHDLVVVRAARVLHPEGEEGQQLGEVERSWSFVDHFVKLLLVGQFADGVEGGPQIALADDAVLKFEFQALSRPCRGLYSPCRGP